MKQTKSSWEQKEKVNDVAFDRKEFFIYISNLSNKCILSAWFLEK